MEFNKHSDLIGKHALLSPSLYSWLNYDEDTDQLYKRYRNQYATQIGTIVHEYAEKRIKYGLKLGRNVNEKNALLFYLLDNGIPRNVIDLNYIFETVNMYVNDSIGFGLEPEVLLYYSDECFGTTDAISFRDSMLRIHDLKTGTIPAHMEQLMIYAALFCLEYNVNPRTINYDLRIYQGGEALNYIPQGTEIHAITSKIIKTVEKIKEFKELEG